jgi:hypothetical protein
MVDFPKRIRGEFERAKASIVVEDLAGGDDLIRAGLLDQSLQALPHSVR